MPKCPRCHFQWVSTERSNPQLRYYFGVVLDILSEETGYDLDECHQLMIGVFLKPRGFKSTVGLTTQEFTRFLEEIKRWAVIKHGINIPDPHEETDEKQSN